MICILNKLYESCQTKVLCSQTGASACKIRLKFPSITWNDFFCFKHQPMVPTKYDLLIHRPISDINFAYSVSTAWFSCSGGGGAHGREVALPIEGPGGGGGGT